MGTVIHARNTEEGLRFRPWSTIVDAYIAKEMTEPELREWQLKVAVRNAIEEHNREIDERIERAKSQGTSSLMGDTRDLEVQWDE